MNSVFEAPADAGYGCAKCGSRAEVRMRSYPRIYTPRWVWLLVLLGPIPLVIAGMIARTTHQLTVPFCDACWARRTRAINLYTLGILGAAAVCMGGVYLGASNGSAALFLAGLLAAAVVVVLAARRMKDAQPKYLVVDAHNVVIEDATRGPVVLVSPAPHPIAEAPRAF
jgi:hypothetical protein